MLWTMFEWCVLRTGQNTQNVTLLIGLVEIDESFMLDVKIKNIKIVKNKIFTNFECYFFQNAKKSWVWAK